MNSYETLTQLIQLRSVRCAIAALVLQAPNAFLFAQDESEDEGDVFELSPFEVNAAEDVGYRARNTLAGSRINTNLKDVAASVSVITEAFMDDVAATDVNDILVYTGNTESTGNFTAAPAAGIGGYDDNTSTSPQTANRVRGLGSATLTRDYFLTIGSGLGFDSYNLSRVTINRGPNSILFGLGNPAGIINYTANKAAVGEDSHEVGLRYGSYDDMRATFDVNRVLVDDKLAVRLSGLWSDRGFKQKPAWYEDERLYLAATYRPTEKTTFDISYEVVDQSQNNPNSITPTDHISSWEAAGSPSWNAATGVWSERQDGIANLTGGSGFVGPTAPDGSQEYVYREGGGEQSWATWWQPNDPDVAVYSAIGLHDNTWVPLHSMNLRPTLNEYDFNVFTASWDQQVVKDLYFNVAYIKEDLDSSGFNFTRANTYGVFMDITSTLPDGRANPRFGETFMPARTLDSKYEGNAKNESIRGTLTYELDLEERNKWLGRHTFTAFAERRERESWNNVYNEIRSGTPSYLDPSDRVNAETWQLTRLRYLGGSASSRATVAPSIPELELSGVPNTYYDATSGAWLTDTYGSTFAMKRRDLNENVVKSSAQVWQSYWLDGKIVGTAGWRQDENEEASVASVAIDPSTGLLIVDDTLNDASVVDGDTTTVGVVAHATDWLSFHYNKSENFVPAAADVNIFGEIIPPPSGEGEDYGFALDLAEGKLNVRFNWFELAQVNSRISNSGPDIAAQWELPYFDQVIAPALAEQMGLTHSEFFSDVPWGDNRIEETADVVSEGMEVELTYNPNDNWRILANVSRQEAVRSNIAGPLTRWVEEVLPVWQGLPYWDGDVSFNSGWGFEGNLQGYIENFNSARILATYKAEEGQPNPQIREWRFNLVTNYTFHDGRLAGWNFGGALRWQDEAAIGHPAITDDQGNLVGLDLANPYTDGGTVEVDAWAGYTTKLWEDRVTWDIQLNLRNLTRDEGFQPIVANSDGTDAIYRIEFGPSWYLSSTFSW